MKVKVLEKNKGCMPQIIKKGDWIDLYTAEEVVLKAPYSAREYTRKGENREYRHNIVFDFTLVSLGVCIKMPKGLEMVIVPRSSTFKKYGVLQTNHYGVVDNSYCGNDDEIKMPLLATRSVVIPKGTRIAQFKIQPSQKATFYQKLKWLLSSKIELIKVDHLESENRGGFGSTGENVESVDNSN